MADNEPALREKVFFQIKTDFSPEPLLRKMGEKTKFSRLFRTLNISASIKNFVLTFEDSTKIDWRQTPQDFKISAADHGSHERNVLLYLRSIAPVSFEEGKKKIEGFKRDPVNNSVASNKIIQKKNVSFINSNLSKDEGQGADNDQIIDNNNKNNKKSSSSDINYGDESSFSTAPKTNLTDFNETAEFETATRNLDTANCENMENTTESHKNTPIKGFQLDDNVTISPLTEPDYVPSPKVIKPALKPPESTHDTIERDLNSNNVEKDAEKQKEENEIAQYSLESPSPFVEIDRCNYSDKYSNFAQQDQSGGDKIIDMISNRGINNINTNPSSIKDDFMLKRYKSTTNNYFSSFMQQNNHRITSPPPEQIPILETKNQMRKQQVSFSAPVLSSQTIRLRSPDGQLTIGSVEAYHDLVPHASSCSNHASKRDKKSSFEKTSAKLKKKQSSGRSRKSKTRSRSRNEHLHHHGSRYHSTEQDRSLSDELSDSSVTCSLSSSSECSTCSSSYSSETDNKSTSNTSSLYKDDLHCNCHRCRRHVEKYHKAKMQRRHHGNNDNKNGDAHASSRHGHSRGKSRNGFLSFQPLGSNQLSASALTAINDAATLPAYTHPRPAFSQEEFFTYAPSMAASAPPLMQNNKNIKNGNDKVLFSDYSKCNDHYCNVPSHFRSFETDRLSHSLPHQAPSCEASNGAVQNGGDADVNSIRGVLNASFNKLSPYLSDNFTPQYKIRNEPTSFNSVFNKSAVSFDSRRRYEAISSQSERVMAEKMHHCEQADDDLWVTAAAPAAVAKNSVVCGRNSGISSGSGHDSGATSSVATRAAVPKAVLTHQDRGSGVASQEKGVRLADWEGGWLPSAQLKGGDSNNTSPSYSDGKSNECSDAFQKVQDNGTLRQCNNSRVAHGEWKEQANNVKNGSKLTLLSVPVGGRVSEGFIYRKPSETRQQPAAQVQPNRQQLTENQDKKIDNSSDFVTAPLNGEARQLFGDSEEPSYKTASKSQQKSIMQRYNSNTNEMPCNTVTSTKNVYHSPHGGSLTLTSAQQQPEREFSSPFWDQKKIPPMAALHSSGSVVQAAEENQRRFAVNKGKNEKNSKTNNYNPELNKLLQKVVEKVDSQNSSYVSQREKVHWSSPGKKTSTVTPPCSERQENDKIIRRNGSGEALFSSLDINRIDAQKGGGGVSDVRSFRDEASVIVIDESPRVIREGTARRNVYEEKGSGYGSAVNVTMSSDGEAAYGDFY